MKKRPTSMAFYIRPTGTQITRGFKVHNLITCESKVQVVVSLGRHWVLTNGTWHVFLQSGNVFELGDITILIVNNSLCYTIYCKISFYVSLYNWRLMMFHPKHVLSSLKSELQKHRVVYQSDIFSTYVLQILTWATINQAFYFHYDTFSEDPRSLLPLPPVF